jgi:hypothetical protein
MRPRKYLFPKTFTPNLTYSNYCAGLLRVIFYFPHSLYNYYPEFLCKEELVLL